MFWLANTGTKNILRLLNFKFWLFVRPSQCILGYVWMVIWPVQTYPRIRLDWGDMFGLLHYFSLPRTRIDWSQSWLFKLLLTNSSHKLIFNNVYIQFCRYQPSCLYILQKVEDWDILVYYTTRNCISFLIKHFEFLAVG